MMNPGTEHIHYLVAAKLAGIATEAEMQELDHLIKTDDAAKQQWEEAIQGISSKDIENHFSKINDWTWKDIDQIRPKPRGGRVVIWSILAAAAVIAGIFISIRIFQGEIANDAPNFPQTATNTNKTIQLQLSTGQVFTLSDKTGTQTFDAGVLQNAGKTLTYSVDSTGRDEDVLAAMNSLIVPIGMDYKVVLSDGTTIWLNSQTELKFPFKFAKGSREIFINGEAFLEVEKDPSRPFLVNTSNGTVQVLGTSFNLNTYDPGVVRVALVEGAVNLKTASAQTGIKPGFEAVYKDYKVAVQKFDADVTLAWRAGKYYFENATIQEIMNVLPRWFGIEVKFDTPATMTETFTGVVNRNKPITIFLDKLKKFGVQYHFDKEGVLHIK